MVFSENDRKLFYDLWKALLDIIDKKYHVNDLKEYTSRKSTQPKSGKRNCGLGFSNQIVFDPGAKKQFKEIYLDAKKSGTLITRI